MAVNRTRNARADPAITAPPRAAAGPTSQVPPTLASAAWISRANSLPGTCGRPTGQPGCHDSDREADPAPILGAWIGTVMTAMREAATRVSVGRRFAAHPSPPSPDSGERPAAGTKIHDRKETTMATMVDRIRTFLHNPQGQRLTRQAREQLNKPDNQQRLRKLAQRLRRRG